MIKDNHLFQESKDLKELEVDVVPSGDVSISVFDDFCEGCAMTLTKEQAHELAAFLWSRC